MRTIINIVLTLVFLAICYLLYASILGPIKFNEEFQKRESAVVNKLKQHRDFQKHYKGLTGEYAKDYDTLRQVLMADSFKIAKMVGDPDAVDGADVKLEYKYILAKDSLANYLDVEASALSGMIDELSKVPYSDNKEFTMTAMMREFQGKNVPVLRVETEYDSFMKEYNSNKYRRYSSKFDPDKMLGYGNLGKLSVAGDWD